MYGFTAGFVELPVVQLCGDYLCLISPISLQIHLVLPWKYSIFIEYHLKSAWPPVRSAEHSVHFDLSIRGANVVTGPVSRGVGSQWSL